MKLDQEKAKEVDQMDQTITKYKVKIQGMKWYLGFIRDATLLNNVWQLHRMCCQDRQVDDLLTFCRPMYIWRAIQTRPHRGGRATSIWLDTGLSIRTRGPSVPSATHKPTTPVTSVRKVSMPSASRSTISLLLRAIVTSLGGLVGILCGTFDTHH